MSGQKQRGGRGRSRSHPSKDKDGKKADPSIQPLEPVAEPPDIESFTEFALSDSIQSAIAGMGITKPTPIQALAIGPVLEGRHVIAKAETGTGKTLAFGAPMMSKMDPARRTVLGLVLSPTRELAEQVHDVLAKLGEPNGIKTALVVGGEPLQPQVAALQAGAQVVVGTPGRVIDLMGQGFLSFPWTEFVVLDEADKMLEIGFLEDIEKILAQVNEYRQTLLFSATFPPPLLKLARGQTENPVEVATASGHSTVTTIRQCSIEVDDEGRARLLQDIVRASAKDDVFLVFCDRRTEVDRLMRRMERERYPVRALHGGYDQAARFRVMGAFRGHEVKVLIATDVASRGLDVSHVTHVINFAAPRDHADYTHRIGRTGRAGREGTAITFVTPATRRYWKDLLRSTGFDVDVLKNGKDAFREKRKSKRDEEREGRSERKPREDGDHSEKKRKKDKDRDDERAEKRRKKDRDDDERSEKKRKKDKDRDDEGRDKKKRDRSRDESRDPERPRKRRSEREEDADTPREEREPRGERPARRHRDEASERPPRRRRDREDERPREQRPRRRDREEEPQPSPREAVPSGGFGEGLDAAEAPAPKARSSRSGGRSTRKEEARPKKEPQPPNTGGFGAGLD